MKKTKETPRVRLIRGLMDKVEGMPLGMSAT
jgi:hypothetical protein